MFFTWTIRAALRVEGLSLAVGVRCHVKVLAEDDHLVPQHSVEVLGCQNPLVEVRLAALDVQGPLLEGVAEKRVGLARVDHPLEAPFAFGDAAIVLVDQTVVDGDQGRDFLALLGLFLLLTVDVRNEFVVDFDLVGRRHALYFLLDVAGRNGCCFGRRFLLLVLLVRLDFRLFRDSRTQLRPLSVFDTAVGLRLRLPLPFPLFGRFRKLRFRFELALDRNGN